MLYSMYYNFGRYILVETKILNTVDIKPPAIKWRPARYELKKKPPKKPPK